MLPETSLSGCIEGETDARLDVSLSRFRSLWSATPQMNSYGYVEYPFYSEKENTWLHQAQRPLSSYLR